ncbi:family 16 glycosylhydrolase [Rufibacter roseus]|uniref:Family 16 glycosylhydrolase n=1 Tax=Rufibacter roseus TaxID=1567108 RepID=A0ABW2DI01_9BACT|nr:family 16 glycosylhydrolase [Rufibacter roseus]
MSRIIYLVLCLGLLCPLGGVAQNGAYNELVWSDEFEEEGAINSTWWNFDLGNGNNGWGNRELQSYTNQLANVRQTGGKLIIEAIKQNGNWTSGRVKTQGKFDFTYGRVEWRAKLAPGVGTWPALWLLGSNISTVGWPACGEIDVMEYIDRLPGKVQAALHTPSSYGNTQNIGSTTVPDATTAFHIYAAEWSEHDIKFYVDNTLYYTYAPTVKDARTWPFDKAQFLIMNIAVGGNMGSEPSLETNGQKNGVDPNLTSTRMEVDYVRVYQQFKELHLSGPQFVNPSAQNVTFKASRLANATYTWTLPSGATIVSGNNSPEIVVNWGKKSGQVKVQMQHNGQTFTKILEVKTKMLPSGSSFLIEGFNPFPASQLTPNAGTFEMSQHQDALKVNFHVTSPSSLPHILYELESPLDMTGYPVFTTSVKTLNKSRTVSLRLDLLDAAGKVTGSNQVFNLSPLIDDGEYYTYHFNYQNLFGSGSGQVDPANISKIRLLVNYGFLGSSGQDSIWVDHFSVLPALPTTPNRASHVAAAMAASGVTLSWRDNAANEQGFKVYRSTQPYSNYSEIASLSANNTSFTDPAGTRESFYKVQAYNSNGTASFSNIGTVGGVMTGGSEEWLAQQIVLSPNPVQQEFSLALPSGVKVKSIRLYGVNGQEVPLQISMEFALKTVAEVRLPTPLADGLYFCRIQTENNLLVKRLLVQNFNL